jgi:dephospho-CoA kinase
MRFERAVARNRPGDPETLEEFVEKEEKENASVSTNQQLENCLKAADVVIINDSSMEDFRKKINEAIAKIQKT